MEKLIDHCYYTYVDYNKYPGIFHYNGKDMISGNIILKNNTPYIVYKKDIKPEEWILEKTAKNN